MTAHPGMTSRGAQGDKIVDGLTIEVSARQR
jgi:hypothetical protein